MRPNCRDPFDPAIQVRTPNKEKCEERTINEQDRERKKMEIGIAFRSL